MHLTQENIATLKQQLLDEKMKLERDLSTFGTKKEEGDFETTFEDMGRDEDEQSSEVEAYVDALAVEQSLEQRLHEVLAALERIEADTYGFDEKTGEPIALERLIVYPAARTAIKKD